MLIPYNLFGRKPLTEDAVRPYLIRNDNRHENQCHNRHDLQRIDTRRGIEYGQIVFRIDAGGIRLGNRPITPVNVTMTIVRHDAAKALAV